MDVISELASVRRELEIAKDYLAGYKARQMHAVIALNAVQVALLKGDLDTAARFIPAALAATLKDAKEVVYNRDFALQIAVKTIREISGSHAALEQIRALVPEAVQ